jgi:transcriptional regulator with XRE-family HTH domain
MRKTITYSEKEWIKYRLALKGLTQADIAARARCSRPMVANVLAGRKASANVTTALVKALGFRSFDELIAGANREGMA